MAFDVNSRRQVWTTPTHPHLGELDRHTTRALSLQDGLLCFGDSDGTINALRPNTGNVIWSRAVPDALIDPYPPPLVFGDTFVLDEIGIVGYSIN
jgi:outer membrane protein assembly factor BamB